MEQKNFWENKKVLITGVNGFVGSNLSENLVQNNANVFGLIRNFEPNTYLFFEKINEKINLINGDITNKELIKTIIVEQNIEIVFHLAAQVEVGIAEKYPYLTWETNIRGTYTLLDAIRESSKNIKSIIVASSDKAYGEYPQELLPYKENYNLKPIFPYDTSKACADIIAQSYTSELYNLPIIITRFSNIYGPGQLNFSALIPDCIKSALGYSKFIPRGNGNHLRDFIYVKDVAELYLNMAQKLFLNKSLKGEIFNAGTKQPKKVKDIIELIFKLIGNKKDHEEIIRLFSKKETSGEITNQSMSYEKVFNHFDWKPTTSLNSGIKNTIKWYEDYLKKIIL